jgi:hypothetical protein
MIPIKDIAREIMKTEFELPEEGFEILWEQLGCMPALTAPLTIGAEEQHPLAAAGVAIDSQVIALALLQRNGTMRHLGISKALANVSKFQQSNNVSKKHGTPQLPRSKKNKTLQQQWPTHMTIREAENSRNKNSTNGGIEKMNFMFLSINRQRCTSTEWENCISINRKWI